MKKFIKRLIFTIDTRIYLYRKRRVFKYLRKNKENISYLMELHYQIELLLGDYVNNKDLKRTAKIFFDALYNEKTDL